MEAARRAILLAQSMLLVVAGGGERALRVPDPLRQGESFEEDGRLNMVRGGGWSGRRRRRWVLIAARSWRYALRDLTASEQWSMLLAKRLALLSLAVVERRLGAAALGTGVGPAANRHSLQHSHASNGGRDHMQNTMNSISLCARLLSGWMWMRMGRCPVRGDGCGWWMGEEERCAEALPPSTVDASKREAPQASRRRIWATLRAMVEDWVGVGAWAKWQLRMCRRRRSAYSISFGTDRPLRLHASDP